MFYSKKYFFFFYIEKEKKKKEEIEWFKEIEILCAINFLLKDVFFHDIIKHMEYLIHMKFI